MEGLFQVVVEVDASPDVELLAESALSLDLSFSRDGGEPIIPPSRNLIVIGGGGGVSELESCSC